MVFRESRQIIVYICVYTNIHNIYLIYACLENLRNISNFIQNLLSYLENKFRQRVSNNWLTLLQIMKISKKTVNNYNLQD